MDSAEIAVADDAADGAAEVGLDDGAVAEVVGM